MELPERDHADTSAAHQHRNLQLHDNKAFQVTESELPSRMVAAIPHFNNAPKEAEAGVKPMTDRVPPPSAHGPALGHPTT